MREPDGRRAGTGDAWDGADKWAGADTWDKGAGGGGPGRAGGREQAFWTRATLGGTGRPLDLLTARFDRHRYAPHAHDEFTIGVCVAGAEVIDYRGGRIRPGPGSIVVLGPGEAHTGGPAATDDGYAYRALYAEVPLLTEGTLGIPDFREPLLDDPELAAALRRTHAELSACPDPLETESRIPWLLTALARRHSTARHVCDTIPGAGHIAEAVRDRLADELLSPPSLAALAADLGLSRYQLLRAFRTSMGMPPYAWLAQYRVNRARCLLESGHRPAEAAALVGFADQAHLTRWFRRVLGVTPAAYRSSVASTAYRNSVQDAGR
ncbi:AraC family transcriptional regulator [Streptomyces tauricus]|uniref:AraC family transcriptional regulator n=1 Tax=Streptomyces tauricus TaxID=68274 RepID=UPI00339F9377